ncbi:MAG: alpha/beta fold hydrolase [Gammaproteobacteria bacterium]|jgi:pimeloyl-ACP methyl ester carboxylesterase|nr:MAG: alpha/beta fold hydrolase [Gammaproteobacteria bacterium]
MRFILVHGLGHGGWCWERTKSELEARGHEVVAPDLPLTSLTEDADTVARLVEAHSPAVVVGHSYGGLVISIAAARTTGKISHLVYLAAAMIGTDEDYLSIMAEHDTPLSADLIDNDGSWLTVSPEKAARAFYNECDEQTTQAAIAQLRPTSVNCHAVTEPLPEPWQQIDSLYVVCAKDEAMPPGAQRVLAKKATRVEELDTDHSPFFSANEALCELLVSYAEGEIGAAAGA